MTIPFVDLWRFCKALGLCKMPPAFWRQGTNGVWNSSRAIHNRFTFKLLPFLRPNALPFAIPVFVPVFGAFLPYLRLVRCLFQYSTAPGGFQYISWQKFIEGFSKWQIFRLYHLGIIPVSFRYHSASLAIIRCHSVSGFFKFSPRFCTCAPLPAQRKIRRQNKTRILSDFQRFLIVFCSFLPRVFWGILR